MGLTPIPIFVLSLDYYECLDTEMAKTKQLKRSTLVPPTKV